VRKTTRRKAKPKSSAKKTTKPATQGSLGSPSTLAHAA
jgi:hypothetical protein